MRRLAPFRPTRRLLPGLTLLVTALLGAASAMAAGTTVESLIAAAKTSYSYGCTYDATNGRWGCTSTSGSGWVAIITPQTGPVTTFEVRANRPAAGGTMDGATSGMMVDLLNQVCSPGDTKTFVTSVGLLVTAETQVAPQAIGPCALTGGYGTRIPRGLPVYWAAAVVSQPTPTPTPTPTPSPTPRPGATPTPTPSPTPAPSASAAPSEAPSTAPSAAASTAPSSTAPSAAASAGATAAPSTPPTARPSTAVLGEAATPAPTPSPTPASGVLGWVDSIPAPAAVRTDTPPTIAAILAAMLLLLLMGWMGELFNNTFEGNYDRILAWWRATRAGRAWAALATRLGGIL